MVKRPGHRVKNLSKEAKKGASGIAAQYITRNRAIKKLHVTLKDFRHLCIVKGIFPRDPKKKKYGTNKTYYHVKDVLFLAHEPLLGKFRELKIYLKRRRRALARHEFDQSKRMEAQKPEFTYDHLVRERYPDFVDALRDLDDGLCMISMFSQLPASSGLKSHTPARSASCLKLYREFQNFVVRTGTLRKVFVSIKGTYYRAEIQGVPITWLVPHQFSQKLPDDVDYRVMLTFLDFYETLLKFVNFKLYHDSCMVYPPTLDSERDAAGAGLSAVVTEIKSTKEKARKSAAIKGPSECEADPESKRSKKKKRDIPCRNFESSGKCKFGSKCVFLHGDKHEISDETVTPSDSKLNLDSVISKIKSMPQEVAESEDVQSAEETESVDEFANLGGESTTEEAGIQSSKSVSGLFSGLKFLLMREVPRNSLEFVVRSFSGTVVFADECTAEELKDDSITHQVVDRPIVDQSIASREYVQPQWIFDSVNERHLLPVGPYGPGKQVPAHLSPFVDHEKAGYVPTEVDERKRWVGGVTAEPKPVDSDSETEASKESEEARYARELREEAGRDSGSSDNEIAPTEVTTVAMGTADVQEGGEGDSSDSSEDESTPSPDNSQSKRKRKRDKHAHSHSGDSGSKKARASGDSASNSELDATRKLEKIMMSKKNTRLYSRMMHGINKKSDFDEKLREKRLKLDAKK